MQCDLGAFEGRPTSQVVQTDQTGIFKHVLALLPSGLTFSDTVLRSSENL